MHARDPSHRSTPTAGNGDSGLVAIAAALLDAAADRPLPPDRRLFDRREGRGRAGALLDELLARYRSRAGGDGEPWVSPVLALAFRLARDLGGGTADFADLEDAVQRLTVTAFARRAAQARRYLGALDPERNAARSAALAARLARGEDGELLPIEALAAELATPRFGIVLTAHPTFSVPQDVSRLLAELACGADASGVPLGPEGEAAHLGRASAVEHRPPPNLSLDVEHRWSMEALGHAHAALDAMNRAILEEARRLYPDAWTRVRPNLVTLATWVGYDLDGRSDITWRDTLGKRLLIKLAQLRRWETAVAALRLAGGGAAGLPLERLRLRLARARDTVEQQHAAVSALSEGSSPAEVAGFARLMVREAGTALTDTAELCGLVEEALAAPGIEPLTTSLLVLAASMRGHGLGLAHTHVRLNASQIHNAIRGIVELDTAPGDPTRRRSFLKAINERLDRLDPETFSYASILAEGASARRLFMVVAAMLKHVDSETPVRFLIAETESGFTLLAALYFARLFGIEDKVEISPLLETTYALEHGEQVLDEALRSPHFKAYVERLGRVAVQFGFSDSGRYLGQMAATFLIERLRLRLAATLEKHGLAHVRLILFNTHGESIGRGAHPESLADRFAYLAPWASRAEFARRGIAVKDEASFHGGDGYLWFMHPHAASAVLRAAMEDRLDPNRAEPDDPVYALPDFANEFFGTVARVFGTIVDDPDYAALLGAFGQNMVERAGSRPVKRQSDMSAAPVELTHPSQLRAIPNNAILQQLGLMANVVSGLGAASAKDPELFAQMLRTSPRFRRALAMASAAADYSDPQAMAAYVAVLDPALWLDEAAAAATAEPGGGERAEACRALSAHLEAIALHDRLKRIYRTLFRDRLLLDGALPEAEPDDVVGEGTTAQEERAILHAIRVALIHRLWLLATRVPEFSPQLGTTVEDMIRRILHLDVEAVVAYLKRIFPNARDTEFESQDFGEPASYRPESRRTYGREHAEIFDPMLRIYTLIRRIAPALSYHAGAIG